MTNRERVLAALNFQKPDYTPYAMSFTQQMAEKMISYTGDPGFPSKINNHITSAFLTKPQTEVRPGFDRDEFGVTWNKTGADKDIGVVEEYLLADAENLNGFQLPPVDEAFIRREMEALAVAPGENFRMASLGFSLFERAWTLRGMENLLCDMVAEPEFVHELMGKITARNLQVIDIALEYEFDGFYFGDDWGQQKGLIMGPHHWRTFLKPYLAQMYGKVRAAGKYVCQHSCGDIREILEEAHEIGLNMYQTFQPEIYGYNYSEKLRNKVTVWGGISTQRDLPSKTPEEVCAVTKELLAAFPVGGLVAGPTHSVPGDVPPENIMAMLSVLEHQN